MDTGELFFLLSNVLLCAGWLTLAAQLFRVRKHDILKGGTYPVIATLICYATMRGLAALDQKPWDHPVLLSILSGLSLTSVWILVRALNDLAQREPCRGTTLILNGDLAKAYKTIKQNEGRD